MGVAVMPRLTEKTAFESTLAGVGFILGGSELLIWLFGSAGLLSFPLILGVLALLVIAVALKNKCFKANLGEVRSSLGIFAGMRGWELACAIYLAVVFLLTFVLTLAPPSGADYDSLVYHLGVPQQYLQAGRISELAYDHHSYFPLGTEMLFTLGLWLKGPVLAKLFHWLMLPLSCLVLVAIGRRHLTLRAGLLAAALFASIPVVQFEASTAYIDLALTAFTLLAFMAFFDWQETRSFRSVLLCAFFCGVCLGTKYLGVLTFGWLFLAMLLNMARAKQVEVKPLLAFCVLPLLIGGGWYFRNFAWVGNPVYPFAYGLFGGQGWTAQMAEAYAQDQKAYGFGRTLIDMLWLPWRLSMTPFNVGFVNSQMVGQGYWPLTNAVTTAGNTGAFEARGLIGQSILGPALLAFSAPVLFMKGRPSVVNFALASMLFFFAFWALTGQYLRYLVPAYAILGIAAGWGIDRYLERSAVLKYTSGVVLACCLLFSPYYVLKSSGSTLPVVLGAQSPDEYLARTFSGYDAMKWASTNTPATSYFAVYGEPRTYYLGRPHFWADDQHNNLIDYEKIKSAANLVDALRGQKATHILLNREAAVNGGFGGPPAYFDEAVNDGQLKLLYESRGYAVYEVEAAR